MLILWNLCIYEYSYKSLLILSFNLFQRLKITKQSFKGVEESFKLRLIWIGVLFFSFHFLQNTKDNKNDNRKRSRRKFNVSFRVKKKLEKIHKICIWYICVHLLKLQYIRNVRLICKFFLQDIKSDLVSSLA